MAYAHKVGSFCEQYGNGHYDDVCSVDDSWSGSVYTHIESYRPVFGQEVLALDHGVLITALERAEKGSPVLFAVVKLAKGYEIRRVMMLFSHYFLLLFI